ncbi:chordin-like protein 1 [Neocloeon triangulifer]|uniref:chordin-like protein 1 n=1 Tax=Neocloeon triangulifer TaxID=2078957 RepID=UPI00286F58A4|nr:chordin-like protein 1 [Neocloeon triangulifer]
MDLPLFILVIALVSAATSKPSPEAVSSIEEKGCKLDGVSYASGQKFAKPGERCVNCHCYNGTLNCSKIECCWIDGCTPVYDPDECCPKWVNCTGSDFDEYLNSMVKFSLKGSPLDDDKNGDGLVESAPKK